MRDLAILFIHLLVTTARLFGPGGGRSVVAESLPVKYQLLVLNRSRARAPSLRPMDRVIVGLCAILMRPARLLRSVIILKPSTVLSFHRALVERKYRLLFTAKTHGKPGPKSHWVMVVMDQFTRRIIGFAVHKGAPDGPGVCRMFNCIISGSGSPLYLSCDNDPLFRYRQWEANLRILEVTEVKTVPYVPLSHPFVERLIGTIRREYLDKVPFWSARDLERKLLLYKEYYNRSRPHQGRNGALPDSGCNKTDRKNARLDAFRWKAHCHGLYQLPEAT